MSNIYLTGCALAISILVNIMFYAKKRVNNIETKIYGILIRLNIVEALTTTMIVIIAITINNTLVLELLNRLEVIVLTVWCSLMFYYSYNISKNNVPKYIKTFLIIFNAIFIILSFILNVTIVNSDGILDSHGPLTNLGLISTGVYIILMCLVLLTKDNKEMKYNTVKYIPLYLLIVLLIITAILRMIIPEINFISIILSFVILIMFHTIENPDIKMLNELNLAKERAEKANNSKTDFLSSVSHEIRTPLNAIVGFSQVLLTKDLPPESKSDIEDIVMASDTLLGIVNGILDISKIEANKLEIINNEYRPKKIIDELIALTKARMGDKPLDFRTHFDSALPDYLYGDSSRVKQVILNILTNSVKYTKDGFIDFRISVVIKDQICRLIISVEDSGVGIKESDINKLFKKFERLNEGGSTSIEGTGLGLAITKKLVEMMGGKIFVQSIYGKGTKFTVALDQSIIQTPKEIKEEINDYTQLIDTIDFSSKKVLVVDDNTLNLKVAQRLLTAYGIQVNIIESGFGLIEKMEAGEVYDLILLDDMMPKLSGTETLEKLRASPDFKIPTIALTANAIEGMREKYLSLGFDDYLAKPIDKKELNRVIIKYLFKK